MDIFKIIIIGIVGTVLAVLLSDYRKDFAIMVGLITGIIIFLMVANLLSETITSLINMRQMHRLKVLFVRQMN